jgi:hypothetical protein
MNQEFGQNKGSSLELISLTFSILHGWTTLLNHGPHWKKLSLRGPGKGTVRLDVNGFLNIMLDQTEYQNLDLVE